ncbi:MAG: MAPEG family protein [Pseudomonadales bacterium]|nr:MAPEG family protein [Pseudomonadales bacterium]
MEVQAITGSPILIPAAVLVLWSLVMLAWVALSRLPALPEAGINLTTQVGGRGADLEGVLPERISWISHNYTHLMEQPTIFYPTIMILVFAGADGATNVVLAWVYVGLRIIHSLVQALWNRVAVRFVLFLAATGALVVLAVNALLAVIG